MRVTVALAVLVLLFLSAACQDGGGPPSPRAGTRAAGPAATLSPAPGGFPNPPREIAVPDGGTFPVDVVRESRFVWPAVGPITTYFGAGHPTGIDIGLDFAGDAPVLASAAGTVSFAGGDTCCEYGRYIVIDHAGGFSTLYGHLSQVLVSVGDRVEQNDLIGLGGATGEADGKHLHFELRLGAQFVDPLRYLPVVQESPYLRSTRKAICPIGTIQTDAASTVTLDFSPAVPGGYRVAGVSIHALTAAGGLPAAQVLDDRPLAVSLSIPPAPVASGQTVSFQVEATLRNAGEEQSVICGMDVRTMVTLPNPERTVFREKPGVPPTITPTATPTLRKPKATVTRTPAPTWTPFGTPKPSATPKPGSPVPGATATPSRR